MSVCVSFSFIWQLIMLGETLRGHHIGALQMSSARAWLLNPESSKICLSDALALMSHCMIHTSHSGTLGILCPCLTPIGGSCNRGSGSGGRLVVGVQGRAGRKHATGPFSCGVSSKRICLPSSIITDVCLCMYIDSLVRTM